MADIENYNKEDLQEAFQDGVIFDHLYWLYANLETLDEFTAESIKTKIWDYAQKNGKGYVLHPFRVALTGKKDSPDAFSVAAVLGKKETLSRIKTAMDKLWPFTTMNVAETFYPRYFVACDRGVRMNQE